MNWITLTKGKEEQEIPLDKIILVKYANGCYEVLEFYIDSDYGMVASSFESYVSPKEVVKYVLILD